MVQLQLFDRQFQRIEILQNAFGIHETQVINGVSHLEFSLPSTDTKNGSCKPFYYIRYGTGDLYRIMPHGHTLTEEGYYNYQCEHVFALLIDDLLEDYHVIGNIGVFTREVIEYILDHQLTKNWILGDCDFERQFEYGWNDETLLSALGSVVNRFVDHYMWTFDTSTYPWVLHLKKLDLTIDPEMYIRPQKNAVRIRQDTDPIGVVTRLYPRGDGEGINTLTIRDLDLPQYNKPRGQTYIQSPQHILDKYGIVQGAWRDKRYTSAETLFEAAQAMLEELQQPVVVYDVDFAVLGDVETDIPRIGKIIELVGFGKSFITEIRWNYEEIIQSTLTIANKSKNIAGTIADMANRQRIESTYAQGATQIYTDSVADNANNSVMQQLNLRLFIPTELVIINKIMLRVVISPFRAYSQATAGGGGITETSEGGGGVITNTGPSGVNVQWTMGQTTPGGDPEHTHWLDMVQSHQHNITLEPHTHNLTLPDHAHQITPIISLFGNPQQFQLLVNGNSGGFFHTQDAEIDLVPFLLDQENRVPRGRWHTISVRPDGLARVEMSYFVQGFIRSLGNIQV